MSISQLPILVFPMLVFTIGLIIIVYYFKKDKETEYEKEMKQLRQFQLSGKLDKQRFLQVKNRMKIDNISLLAKKETSSSSLALRITNGFYMSTASGSVLNQIVGFSNHTIMHRRREQ